MLFISCKTMPTTVAVACCLYLCRLCTMRKLAYKMHIPVHHVTLWTVAVNEVSHARVHHGRKQVTITLLLLNVLTEETNRILCLPTSLVNNSHSTMTVLNASSQPYANFTTRTVPLALRPAMTCGESDATLRSCQVEMGFRCRAARGVLSKLPSDSTYAAELRQSRARQVVRGVNRACVVCAEEQRQLGVLYGRWRE